MYPKIFYEKVIKFYSQSKNIAEASRKFEIPESTIRGWVKGKVDFTRESLKNCGRKKKLSSSKVLRVKRTIRKLNSQRSRVTASKIKDDFDLNEVSLRTVQRTIADLNFKYCKPSSEIILTSRHKKRRVELAEKWIRKKVRKWKS